MNCSRVSSRGHVKCYRSYRTYIRPILWAQQCS
jgi:hypothetical protein